MLYVWEKNSIQHIKMYDSKDEELRCIHSKINANMRCGIVSISEQR